MNSHDEHDKWTVASLALIRTRNLKEAAEDCGLTPNEMLLALIKEPDFRRQVQVLSSIASSPAQKRLRDNQSGAVDAILKILNDAKASPTTQLRAAQFVLAQARDFKVEGLDALDLQKDLAAERVGTVGGAQANSQPMERAKAPNGLDQQKDLVGREPGAIGDVQLNGQPTQGGELPNPSAGREPDWLPEWRRQQQLVKEAFKRVQES